MKAYTLTTSFFSSKDENYEEKNMVAATENTDLEVNI